MKPWYQSKTIWLGVATIALAALDAALQLEWLRDAPEWVLAALGAMVIGLRSITKEAIK